MGKKFNNKGLTLVEVLVAVAILGIIMFPFFDTIIQTVKTNVLSDLELRMNAKVVDIIEHVKATNTIPAGPIYVDKFFKSANAANYDYKIEVTKEPKISESTTTDSWDYANWDNYDRWDFEVELKDNEISLSQNTGIYEADFINGKLYQKKVIKIFPANQALTLDFIGQKDNISQNKYICNYGTGTVDFRPGYGTIDNSEGQVIVVNVVDNRSNKTEYNLTVKNNTCYKTYVSSTNYELNYDGDELKYNKHLLINLYNTNDEFTVNKDIISPYVEIYRRSVNQPHIKNGDKIIVKVIDRNGKVVKSVTSIIRNE